MKMKLRNRTIRMTLGVSGRVLAIAGGLFLFLGVLSLGLIESPTPELRWESYTYAAQLTVNGLRMFLWGLLLFVFSRNLTKAKAIVSTVSERLKAAVRGNANSSTSS